MDGLALARRFADEVLEDYESDSRGRRFDRVLDAHLSSLVRYALAASGFTGGCAAPCNSLFVLADGGRASRPLPTQDALTAGALGCASKVFGKFIASGEDGAVAAAMDMYSIRTENALIENNWKYLDPLATQTYFQNSLQNIVEGLRG